MIKFAIKHVPVIRSYHKHLMLIVTKPQLKIAIVPKGETDIGIKLKNSIYLYVMVLTNNRMYPHDLTFNPRRDLFIT